MCIYSSLQAVPVVRRNSPPILPSLPIHPPNYCHNPSLYKVLHISSQNLLWNLNTAITTKIFPTDFSGFLTPTSMNHKKFHLPFILLYLKFTLLSQTITSIATYAYWLQPCWWIICKQKKNCWGSSCLLRDHVFHSLHSLMAKSLRVLVLQDLKV